MEDARRRSLDREHIQPVRLIWEAWERHLSDDEKEVVREHVAAMRFPPREVSVPHRIQRMSYQGHTYRQGDRELTGTLHYLDHVVRERQWPDGTTELQYYRDIEVVVFDTTSRMFVNWFRDEETDMYRPQLGIIGETDDEMVGPAGAEELLVEYRIDIRGWTTAFQIRDAEQRVRDQERTGKRRNLRWLK